jgi:hypothetical protein
LSVAAAVLITNHGKLDIDGLVRLFTGAAEKTEAGEFIFDALSDKDLAYFAGGVAEASTAAWRSSTGTATRRLPKRPILPRRRSRPAGTPALLTIWAARK